MFVVGGGFECAEVRLRFSPLPGVEALAYVSYAYDLDRSQVLEHFFDVAGFVVKLEICVVLCRE